MDRRTFLQTTGMLLAGAAYGQASVGEMGRDRKAGGTAEESNPPLMDLHVHRSEQLTIEAIVAKSRELNMKIGVMENVAPWGITDNEGLKAYIEELSPYPVYIGLQPMAPGWSANLSPELIARADYIIMDPQIVENGNGYGETIHVWKYNAYIDDPETFMERNMAHYMNILTGEEPLDVFACPLLLPCCIQREYHSLWTRKRLSAIIDAAQAKGVAIEISDVARVPHEEFILMAKRAGLKFTFGSDSRNHRVGRLDYCKRVAKRCRLTENDFFIPKRKERG